MKDALSRRERQLMDILFARGSASVAEVCTALPDPPSYSAVRALLRILEEKGHLAHREEGKQYIYFPTQERPVAAQSALKRVVQTFFGGSVERAVTALLTEEETQLSDDELARLSELIARTKEKDDA
ncbi:BlaI/MecI/CopY family transcriptional regulator [Armatimonas rosea]|uniref:Putative transcriptional regulator n=1 Tax=Armatimonas rosea TaxID=685828 RepID=A0A7W9W719_ARMRO|nr:BlaI/MecI/CopY family transcriptional regulator [Armatimonas rosea]MBB6050655.1 putative transcriptional regulator [Armatimonas rosea]